jgi:hypothetical protein
MAVQSATSEAASARSRYAKASLTCPKVAVWECRFVEALALKLPR